MINNAFTNLKINESIFEKTIKVSAIYVSKHRTNDVIKCFNSHILYMKNQHNVIKVNDPDYRLVLLNSYYSSDSELPVEIRNFIVNNPNSKIDTFDIKINYSNYSYDEALKIILKDENVTIPSGFETIGDIIILNFKDENQYNHRHIIAKVIHDKNPTIKSIVLKTNAISNVYRTSDLELVSGIDNFETTHIEGKCSFTMDVRNVYFCSRLKNERDIILNIIKPTDIIADIFCGIGPFAIRVAEKGCYVYANDLNPECYKYLKINVQKNKVENLVKCFNKDAIDVINDLVSYNNKDAVNVINDLVSHNSVVNDANDINDLKKYRFTYVYMNLPCDAIEFLYVFQGMMRKANPKIWTQETTLPKIIVYCFDDGDTIEQNLNNLHARIKKVLVDYNHTEDFISLHYIKEVSSQYSMFCYIFKLNSKIVNGEIIQKS